MLKSLENVTEADFDQAVADDVETVGRIIAEGERRLWGSETSTWSDAAEIIKQIKPVPWVFWIMIRPVYGRIANADGKPVDPMTFSLVENILFRALRDPLIISKELQKDVRTITEATSILTLEVCASLCFIHSVCKRVSSHLSQRIFRAIIDDALIRARLGCALGRAAPTLGVGPPMLAGFVGRAGLAIQLASGSEEMARECLNSLATGQNISDIGTKIYGCDPLQVSALALVQGGCRRELAVGISAYSLPSDEIKPGTTQSQWLSMFSILEHARVQTLHLLSEQTWEEVGLDANSREVFVDESYEILRRGHRFDWILKQLSQMLEKDN